MQRIIFSIAIVSVLTVSAFKPPAVSAQEQTCVQVYGGGVVCGAAAPQAPVPTGLGDNLMAVAAGLLLASGVLLYFAKRTRQSSGR